MNGTAPLDAEHVGRLLLELHTLPHSVDYPQFQEAALTRLAHDLPLDSAWWGLTSGLAVHTEVMYRLPSSYSTDWEQVKESDPIVVDAISHPFVTACYNARDLRGYPALCKMLEAHDIRHVLCTRVVDHQLGLHAFLSVYRKRKPFTEQERRLKEIVMPHLVHAQHLAWQRHLHNALWDDHPQDGIVASGVVDGTGVILTAEARLSAVLLLEWPHWRGPLLPEELLSSYASAQTYSGRRIRVTFREVSGLTLVRAGERSLIGTLSRRELEVAEAYATGRTYKDIALTLELSPATVRHYIRTIFGKLQIENKTELARLMLSLKHL